ncbi:hypothetical protein [Brevundimonas basaltis]|uniref:Uncharacterized protein n=1 Tax=Brevundimonas basaltis TaxID=472166 RepID=A0A7W8MH73_9CAUL|nr:hypothetical protein [Brevundimonas basaltis]MBB5292665.1 hypothetical protein [Brevundimonas basaltis]
MKRSEQPIQRVPMSPVDRSRSAGLYGEVVVLPSGRPASTAPLGEPKTFL